MAQRRKVMKKFIAVIGILFLSLFLLEKYSHSKDYWRNYTKTQANLSEQAKWSS
jgi:uncharacterized membrane protein (Fun14 family)